MHELRCGQKLFGKVTDTGLIEVACGDCRKDARRTNPGVILVLHTFTLAGELVSTRELQLMPYSPPR
jgi:hypothetical protein